ncbi:MULTISPECIES: hypothetical protein [Citrobacter]|uniref:hypothetical protein n=1 Tax=Citrobacter TaxID=544 RepID=UPI001907B838|nr:MULTISPECIES: hypothetical protein [Citrobacter]MBJ9865645.1 hypothetical protein [Citrobacter amalonaticus]MDU7775203.1 hypothetical protein [Citrobacter sp.]
MQINKIASVRKALLEALEAQQIADEQSHSEINKASDNAIQNAVDAYLSKDLANKGKTISEQKADAYHAFTESGGQDLSQIRDVGKRTIKTLKPKGIALTHEAQKYSANLRPVSLLMKADVNSLTDEQRAALERLGYSLNGKQGA